jgi:transcriptional regulator with XRE-family HTH domain
LTQEAAAERLSEYVDHPWSKATWSAAERSVDGEKERRFSADELLALARAFDVPVGWFYLPPEEGDYHLHFGPKLSDAPWLKRVPLTASELFDVSLRLPQELLNRVESFNRRDVESGAPVIPDGAGRFYEAIAGYATEVVKAAWRGRRQSYESLLNSVAKGALALETHLSQADSHVRKPSPERKRP